MINFTLMVKYKEKRLCPIQSKNNVLGLVIEDWEDNISYDELMMLAQDGISEDGNLLYGQNTTAAAAG